MPKKTNMQSSAARHRARSNESRPLRRDRSTQTQVRGDPEAVSTSCSNSDELAIQLLLDPRVTALEFRSYLSFSGREVPVEMFVADLDDGGRVAFDLIDDERPYRDIDAEGLLLLALQSHNIRLIEIDHAVINAEPRASNTRRLWSFREHRVPPPLRATVDRALAVRRRLTIRSLASIIGLRDPMPTIGALVSQGVLAIDLSRTLGPNSVVGRRSDRWRSTGKSNFFG